MGRGQTLGSGSQSLSSAEKVSLAANSPLFGLIFLQNKTRQQIQTLDPHSSWAVEQAQHYSISPEGGAERLFCLWRVR